MNNSSATYILGVLGVWKMVKLSSVGYLIRIPYIAR